VVKYPFAKEFTGTVVANRAQVVSSGKQKSWMTTEFDPMSKELIPVMGLKDGQIMKNKDGITVAKWMTYQDLKKAKSTTNPDGSVDRHYVYFTILYIKLEGQDEVVKLKVKGGGRGNYIDYVKSLQKKGLEPFTVITRFYTSIDPSSNKYAVFFEPTIDEQGQVKQVQEQQEVIQAMKTLIEEKKTRMAKLTPPQDMPVIDASSNEEINNNEIPFP
jgi:hypothetical protein